MKKIIKFNIVTFIALFLLVFPSCDKNQITDLDTYLKTECAYVYEVNGFYIVSSDERPSMNETTTGTTAKDVFEHSVRLFSSFLDQDEDGEIDSAYTALVDGLAQHMLFVSGHLKFVDKVSFAKVLENKNLYAMTMQTNNWPYVREYDGTGWTVNELNSSTWRPDNMNALWEEVFHTLTEAYSRMDSELAFTEGAKLRQYMDDDIAAGTYDISVQNQAENGNYDKVTAVNEYIHQIWMIQFAGQEDKLNEHQKKALELMKVKGVPMTLNPNYNQTIGTRVKG